MTAFPTGRRAKNPVPVRNWLTAAGLALVIIASATTALFAFGRPHVPTSQHSVTVKMTAAAAEQMVAATSTAPQQIRAVGERAKMINAALAFSSAPVQASVPFSVAAAGTDHQRALLCLTQAVYYEAGFEPLEGRKAVAQVVLNRMRHPAFPKSVCGVVYQGARSPVCQFSFVCDGSLYRAPAPAAWAEARKVATAALAGYVETFVGSATHYHADYVAPRWAPQLVKIAKLGTHIFYRWPGTWGQQAAFTGRYSGEPYDPLSLRPAPKPNVAQDAEITSVVDTSGPLPARAQNDVGGLLDTSKGWTLSIPGPDDVRGASTNAIVQQKAARTAPPARQASHAPVVASL